MIIKDTIEKIPGGLMFVPLLLGATINTIDQLHLSFIMNILKQLGAPKTEQGHYEMLQIGGFS
ncbi:2-keto-3-deoxygluconate permease, partial [Staphylococcus simulans]|uniref:2-keto-3-deoxygluconate permease n=1 Tax=Staphylococcus simulans TaxID=1286 RepID=UPI0030BD113D